MTPIVTCWMTAMLLGTAGPADDRPGIAVERPAADAVIGYAEAIEPILEAKCVGCHNAAVAENRLNMETVAGMLKGGKNGPALVAGNAGSSLLFRMAAHRVDPVMPPADKKDFPPLTGAELGLLQRWIDAGAKDDTDADSAGPPPVELGDLPPGIHPILALDMTADGGRVAVGRGNRVQIYDAEKGKELANLGGHRDLVQAVRFSPDGRRLAAGSYQIVTVWEADESAESGWKLLATLGPHAYRILALDFNPHGNLLAVGGGEPTRSGEVRVWELPRALPIYNLDGLHSDSVYGVRFSPSGDRLATVGADKLLKVTRMDRTGEVRTYEGHTDHVLAVDWKGDGTQLLTGGADKLLKVWDAANGEQLRTLQPAGKQVTAVRWVPGKPIVAGAAGDRQVRFWNPENGGVQRAFSGPAGYVFAVATSADGGRVAAGGDDGTLFLWRADNGQVLAKIPAGPQP